MNAKLPLVPFERYQWIDGRPAQLATMLAELRFGGVLDHQQLARSLAIAVRRHPLLTATIDDSAGGGPCWRLDDQRDVELQSGNETVTARAWHDAPVDLTSGSGLRAWSGITDGRTRVVFEIHHACCDGIAMLGFFADLLVVYAALVAGNDPVAELPPLDAERLKARAHFELFSGKISLGARWFALREWLRILSARPAPLAPAATPRVPVPRSLPDFMARTLDCAVLDDLLAAAKRLGVTLNDLVVCIMFRLLAEYSPDPRRRPLRVLVPLDMRTPAHASMPAANVMSYAVPTRKRTDCTDGRALLAGLHAEMSAIKEHQLGLVFLGGLATGFGIPGLVPWMLRRDACFATVVLSNLGRVLGDVPLPREDGRIVVGGVPLDEMWAAPPIRQQTAAAFVVSTYAGRLSVILRTDPAVLGADETARLLDLFVDRIVAVAQSPERL